MKRWFNGGHKGTLSDVLSKTDSIGKQLRSNEDELVQMPQALPGSTRSIDFPNELRIDEPSRSWQKQTLKPEHVIQYAAKESELEMPSSSVILEMDPKEILENPRIKLKSNIIITFSQEDTILLNEKMSDIIMLLNISGEQFDLKMTGDSKGGQNLNVIASSYIIGQILALFE